MGEAVAIELADRARVVLTTPVSSTEARAVLGEAEGAHAKIGADLEAARVVALNPLTTSAEAASAQGTVERLTFELRRLAELIKALEHRVAELQREEVAQAHARTYDAAAAANEDLVRRLARAPALIAELRDLIAEIAPNAERIGHANANCGSRPRLVDAEVIARKVPSNWSHGVNPIPRLADCKLVAFEPGGDSWVWPPARRY